MRIFKTIKIIYIVIREHWRAILEFNRTLDKFAKTFNTKWYYKMKRKETENL